MILKKNLCEETTAKKQDYTVLYMEIKINFFSSLIEKKSKYDSSLKYAIHIPINFPSEYYVYPSGIYFFKYIQSPWSIVLSKRTGKIYHFNSENGYSTYDLANNKSLTFSNPK